MTFTPIDVDDLDRVDAMLTELQMPWANSLTETEAAALDDYKRALGRDINAHLRGELLDDEAGALAARLKRALGTAVAPADMLLHRGLGPEEAALYRLRENSAVLSASAFMSTTLALKVAERFTRRGRGTAIEIVVRKGQRGVAYVHPFPRYRFRQYEVLLNVGTPLKVLRADDEVIRLEVRYDDDMQ